MHLIIVFYVLIPLIYYLKLINAQRGRHIPTARELLIQVFLGISLYELTDVISIGMVL